MTITSTASPLLDTRIPVQARLSAAWAALMFLYLYADYLLLYQPGIIDGLRAGTVHEVSVTLPFLIAALTSLAVPILMVPLSLTLPARVNRTVNLVVGVLCIPYTAVNGVGSGSWFPFFGVVIAVELALLGFVLRAAWAWPRDPAPRDGSSSTPSDADLLTSGGRA